MNTKDYCSLQIAEWLKELGFDWPCHYAYSNKGQITAIKRFINGWVYSDHFDQNYNDCDNRAWAENTVHCSAPTLAQAQKWLRDVKGVAINIIAHDGGEYTYELIYLPNFIVGSMFCGFSEDPPVFNFYEDALNYALEKILFLVKLQ